jgi:hypothetical protein
MAAVAAVVLANKVQIPLVLVLLTHKAVLVEMELLQLFLELLCTVAVAAVAAPIQEQLIRQVALAAAVLEAAAEIITQVSQPEQ